MKISSFINVTEPEKMGFRYLECIQGALSFCDEILVVCGRKEEESEEKMRALSDKVRVINTDAWPETDWSYDVMRDHFQIGLDNCDGDIVLKLDADAIFNTHPKVGPKIRETLLEKKDCHRIDFGRIDCVNTEAFIYLPLKRVLYAINKKLLIEESIGCEISNKSGSNQPLFFKKGNPYTEIDIKRDLIFDSRLIPYNYDNFFMNAKQISKKWIDFHRGLDIKNKKPKRFELDEHKEAMSNFVKYKQNKLAGDVGNNAVIDFRNLTFDKIDDCLANYGALTNHVYLSKDLHPENIKSRINNMSPEMWGSVQIDFSAFPTVRTAEKYKELVNIVRQSDDASIQIEL